MGSLRHCPGLRLEPIRFRANHQRHFGRLFVNDNSSNDATVKQDRKALRRTYRRDRGALTLAERARLDAQIVHHASTHLRESNIQRVACFAAADGEPDLADLMAQLHHAGVFIALPVVGQRGHMIFREHQPDHEGQVNRYGIFEPNAALPEVDVQTLQVVLTPLVAFDDCGNRLGMGSGYYDRHFASLPDNNRPEMVGVAYELQRADHLTAEHWDVRLDAVVTEFGWQQFG